MVFEPTFRSIRRYVERAEELMLAVAKGEFPGESRMGSGLERGDLSC